MTLIKNWTLNVLDAFHAFKDEKLSWKSNNQAREHQLKHAQVLAEKALEAELKKRAVQIEHEILLLKTQNDTDLAMFKTKCKQDIKDYKQYLNALDQLKKSIQTSYTHLPEAVAFTIHHHAKHLLNQMWEAKDFEQKMRHEMQLIQFMSTIHEEAHHYLADSGQSAKLPEKTLALIQKH